MNKMLKIATLATLTAAFSMFTGCPTGDLQQAVAKDMAGAAGKSISKAQAEPKKALIIAGIPSEYEEQVPYVYALEPQDSLGKQICWSGLTVAPVKNGTAKTSILEMKAGSSSDAAISMVKAAAGIAKSCDSKGRIVVLNFPASSNEEKTYNSFIYTKGVNICEVKENATPADTVPTHSFSTMESTLNFGDFMPIENCEALANAVKSMPSPAEQDK